MAGVPAGLPAGVRVSDHISLGVIARTFPPDRVQRVLAETGKASERERDLPAQVMVYYAIAMALYMGSSTREVLRCLLEGLRWLWGADAVKVAGKSGISQARSRLGELPLRRLYEQVVQPLATRATKGAWYRTWRLVSLDGSSLDVTDTAENGTAFGYPSASRGESAFPNLRFVSLVENGTHVLFGAKLGRYADSETTLAHDVVLALRAGMLCLADRYFFGYALWRAAAATGADLLWRVKGNVRLPRVTVLADGSYLSVIYPSEKDRRHATNGMGVRVVEYRLEGVADAEPLYRLVTTILDPAQAPAADLAALYHERWEIDIDQAWRLSRIKGWVVGGPHRREYSAPGRRRGADHLQVGHRGSVGGDQLGGAATGYDRAAGQAAVLNPVVERRLRHAKFFGQFADRPFIRLSLRDRPRPARPGFDDAGRGQKAAHH